MPRNATPYQHDLMRRLCETHGGDERETCNAFAKAEGQGLFFRKNGHYRLMPDAYAHAVWADGIARGWLMGRQAGSDQRIN